MIILRRIDTTSSTSINNIKNFIGDSNNIDTSVTEFTEENFIISGDSLEDAIDKIDVALANIDGGQFT